MGCSSFQEAWACEAGKGKRGVGGAEGTGEAFGSLNKVQKVGV